MNEEGIAECENKMHMIMGCGLVRVLWKNRYKRDFSINCQ